MGGGYSTDLFEIRSVEGGKKPPPGQSQERLCGPFTPKRPPAAPRSQPLPGQPAPSLAFLIKKENVQLPCRQVASMNRACASSYGMSQQKEEFLIPGAWEEAEGGQLTEYPPLTATPIGGTSGQFWFPTLTSNSKSLPPFPRKTSFWSNAQEGISNTRGGARRASGGRRASPSPFSAPGPPPPLPSSPGTKENPGERAVWAGPHSPSPHPS